MIIAIDNRHKSVMANCVRTTPLSDAISQLAYATRTANENAFEFTSPSHAKGFANATNPVAPESGVRAGIGSAGCEIMGSGEQTLSMARLGLDQNKGGVSVDTLSRAHIRCHTAIRLTFV